MPKKSNHQGKPAKCVLCGDIRHEFVAMLVNPDPVRHEFWCMDCYEDIVRKEQEQKNGV